MKRGLIFLTILLLLPIFSFALPPEPPAIPNPPNMIDVSAPSTPSTPHNNPNTGSSGKTYTSHSSGGFISSTPSANRTNMTVIVTTAPIAVQAPVVEEQPIQTAPVQVLPTVESPEPINVVNYSNLIYTAVMFAVLAGLITMTLLKRNAVRKRFYSVDSFYDNVSTLKKYFAENFSKYPREQIIQFTENSGYSKEEIDEALRAFL